MSQKKRVKQGKTSQANEPETPYGLRANNKVVHSFSSFEEMEDDNYKWLASLTPEQHLRNATALIKRIFADDLKKHPRLGNKITFD